MTMLQVCRLLDQGCWEVCMAGCWIVDAFDLFLYQQRSTYLADSPDIP
jgi:hypothetical protein